MLHTLNVRNADVVDQFIFIKRRAKMTVGGCTLFIMILIIIASMVTAAGISMNTGVGWALSIVIGIIISIGVLYGIHWYYGNTQSGKRAMKSQQSNFEEGLERTVRVYDIEGDLIQEYSGKFDIDYDAERIIFDDDNGKRHVIYYSTATVIIDEK
jgi:hypothetical protein